MMDSGEKYGRDLAEKIKSRVNDRIRNGGRYGNGRYNGLIPGAVILAIGAIFLLNNMGIVNAGHFFQFWPLILIFAGIVKLADPCRRAWGAMLLVFGVLLQMNQLGFGHFSWGEMWPIVLIAAGAFAMWSALQARKMTEGVGANPGDPLTTLNESAIFGGVQKRVNAKEFRGGQLQSLFGGIEIDLRDAEIAENEAVLHANAVFGGIELRVPETWYVAARGQGIFGGYTDSTRYTAPADPDKPKKTLIVVGTALFGGVEIRN
jgi:predicted membrane protein